jgi:hypothetical protein
VLSKIWKKVKVTKLQNCFPELVPASEDATASTLFDELMAAAFMLGYVTNYGGNL